MAQSNRIVFIDLLRGWAVLVMIEVHVFNAFIRPELKETGWYHVLNFVNGLVAPSFLFVAGLVFVIVSERKLGEFRSFGAAFRKQIGRIILIWAVGYALHIPFYSFRRTLAETSETGWLKFCQVDVLHCIAAGLLILFIARLMFKTRAPYSAFLWAAFLFFVGLAPFLWDIDFQKFLHPAIAAYLNGQSFSQFPLFPWLGFMLAGGIVGVAYLESREQAAEAGFVRLLAWWGTGLVAFSFLGEFPVHLPLISTQIRANPFFFMQRLGIVLLLLVVCWEYAVRRKTEKSFVLEVSRESLLVYTAHLLLIYGTFWNDRSFAAIYDGAFSPPECLAITLSIMLFMIVASIVWGRMKQRSRPLSRRIALTTGLVTVVIFFIK